MFVWTTADGFEFGICTDDLCDDITIVPTGILAKNLNIEPIPVGGGVVALINPDGVFLTLAPAP